MSNNNNKVGIFVDINDQFFRVRKKWEGKRINYEKFYEKCKSFGEISYAFAYGTHIEQRANKFISLLHHIGFDPKFRTNEKNKHFNLVVGMSVDIASLIGNNKIDIVILGSSARELISIIDFAQGKGIRTIVFSSCIPKEVRNVTNEWLEVTEEMLDDYEVTTNRNN